MAWRLHNRSWRDGGGRSCRAETQRVTQPDTPLSTGPSAPAGGAVVPSLGTPQLKSCTTGSCPQSRARLFLRRGGEGPRGRHALPVGKPTSTNLIRWYLHSPLLIPARPPRCSAMRNRSLTAIVGHTYRGKALRRDRVERAISNPDGGG